MIINNVDNNYDDDDDDSDKIMKRKGNDSNKL